jgi:hypothetical protein
VADFRETIMENDIRDEGIQGGRFDSFETRAILLKNDRVPTVKSAQKEHDHQERWNCDLTPRKFQGEAVKARTIFYYRLGLPLHIVEKREEGRESVGNGVRTTVLHQSGQHFKTAPMV